MYELNLHSHVRIWLSIDPNEFLNFENQLRLVRMRVTNPYDTIYFCYASTLLTEDSLRNMADFCAKYYLIPLCVERDVLPLCCDNPVEMRLVDLYHQEIAAIMSHGGNPAAASDILRWLTPLHRGIYSDFDVIVNTSSLPPKIIIDAPLVINCGSLKNEMFAAPEMHDLEVLFFNNDIIGVASTNDPVLKQELDNKIRGVQESIYHACTLPDLLCQYTEQKNADIQRFIYQRGIGDFNFRADPTDIFCADMVKIALQDPEMNNVPLFIRKRCEDISGYIESRMLAPSYRARMLDKWRGIYMCSVLHTTGPAVVQLALFERVVMSIAEIEVMIKPYALSHYNLDANFRTENFTVKFHLNPHNFMDETTDVSWTSDGKQAVMLREWTMERTAGKLQQIYRFYHPGQENQTVVESTNNFGRNNVC